MKRLSNDDMLRARASDTRDDDRGSHVSQAGQRDPDWDNAGQHQQAWYIYIMSVVPLLGFFGKNHSDIVNVARAGVSEGKFRLIVMIATDNKVFWIWIWTFREKCCW